jgi:hypothetical protein
MIRISKTKRIHYGVANLRIRLLLLCFDSAIKVTAHYHYFDRKALYRTDLVITNSRSASNCC